MLNKLCLICNINFAFSRLAVRQIVNVKDTIINYLYDVILNTENKKLDL